MFHEWDNFYLILGPTAGALIGLLFVVVTLTAGMERASARRGASIFMSPTVLHFAVVLALSILVMAPYVARPAYAALVAVAALFGFGSAIRVALMIRAGKAPPPNHWSDIHLYGHLPALIYAVLAVAAAAIFRGQPWGGGLMAASAVALLLMAIRNSWDLVVWLAGAARTEKPGADVEPAA